MADEEKKPRHRLGADELLEEVQAAVAKIINLLESNGLAEESVEHLVSLVKGLDFMGTLDLSKRLGLSMPDVPHEELVASLLDAWDCVVYKTGHTRKQMYRKGSFAQFLESSDAASAAASVAGQGSSTGEGGGSFVNVFALPELKKLFGMVGAEAPPRSGAAAGGGASAGASVGRAWGEGASRGEGLAAVVAAASEGGRGGAWPGGGGGGAGASGYPAGRMAGAVAEAVQAFRMIGGNDSDTESSESMASLMREIRGFESDSEDSMGYDSDAQIRRRWLARMGAGMGTGRLDADDSEDELVDLTSP